MTFILVFRLKMNVRFRFVFGRKWNFNFVGIFVYGRKWKMLFGRPLVYITKRSWSWSWDAKSWSWTLGLVLVLVLKLRSWSWSWSWKSLDYITDSLYCAVTCWCVWWIFKVFCIIIYLLHVQCIGNIMCHCGTKIYSVSNQYSICNHN